jgi:hypothetical protein
MEDLAPVGLGSVLSVSSSERPRTAPSLSSPLLLRVNQRALQHKYFNLQQVSGVMTVIMRRSRKMVVMMMRRRRMVVVVVVVRRRRKRRR